MTHDPLPPLTPEEGGLHGEIPDTPEMRAWFGRLGEKVQSATHDPLCYMAEGKWDGGCQCDLIARVRADQRGQDAQVIDDIARQTHHHVGGSVEVCDKRRGDRCDITASLKAAAWPLRRKP